MSEEKKAVDEKIRDLFFGIKLDQEDLFVEEINKTITIKEMTSAQCDQMELLLYNDDGKIKAREMVAVVIGFSCYLQGSDTPVFNMPDDLEKIGGLPDRVIKKIYRVAKRLSRIGANEVEKESKK